MEAGPSSGKAGFNSILGVLFFAVAGLVLYTAIAPWGGDTGPSGPDRLGEEVERSTPAPPEPGPTATVPALVKDGTAAAPISAPGADSVGKALAPPLPTSGEPASSEPAAEDEFAKDWSFRSLIGDIVELDFGDGTGRDVRLGKPFDTPAGERATVVEIGPDGKTVIAERSSDGMRRSIPKLTQIDLTEIKPVSAEAYRFSVNKLEEPREKELAEPHIDGRKVSRYFLAHAPSRVLFELPEPFARFRAKGYLGHERGNVRFVVKADGAVLYSSDALSEPGSVDINVTFPSSPKILELVVDPLGPNTADHSFWLEPVLEK